MSSQKHIVDSYTADQALIALAEHANSVSSSGLTWGLPTLDNYGRQPLPEEYAIFLAREGSMKTTFCTHLMRHWSRQLYTYNQSSRDFKCGIIVKYEEGVEPTRMSLWNTPFKYIDVANGKIDKPTMVQHAGNQIDHPMFYVGSARTKLNFASHTFGGTQPTIKDIADAIEVIANGKSADGRQISPSFVIVDYIQKVTPHGKYDGDTERMSMVSEQLYDIGKAFKCFMACAAQAMLKGNDSGIPNTDEVMGSSRVSQDADMLFGFNRPSKNKSYIQPKFDQAGSRLIPNTGTMIDIEGYGQVTATNNMIVARVNKYRYTRSAEGRKFPIWFNNSGDATECSPYGQTQYMPSKAWLDGNK